MGGTISVTSEVGKGSIFVVELPFEMGAAPEKVTDFITCVTIQKEESNSHVVNEADVLRIMKSQGKNFQR